MSCFGCVTPPALIFGSERARPAAPRPHAATACAPTPRAAPQKGRRKGYIDVRRWGVFGGDVVREEACKQCDATAVLQCPRCRGAKKLFFRSAEWR